MRRLHWHSKRVSQHLRRLAVSAVLPFLPSCALLPPSENSVTQAERLEQVPKRAPGLARPVTIYWDSHQIPFIEAETDEDLGYTLGLVHAHLRLAQMEMLRRIARGRISEALGPIAVKYDHALRLLNFARAAPAVVASMPPETRRFVAAYVAGINFYLEDVRTLPHEFAVFGFAREPWTTEDIVAVGRLASIDVNWIVWFGLLAQRAKPDWPAIWRRLIGEGVAEVAPHATTELAAETLATLLRGAGRTGSNAFAVSGGRTRSGAAIVAGDPHLGLFLPNPWLIAGMSSPSYRTVGLMVPGLPFVALGRNERIAWAGTNLHAAASELVNVSRLPPSSFTVRRERIRVRFWFDQEIELRDSPYGPVISDSSLVAALPDEAISLRWVGHDPSDEITALLSASRAADFESFRKAFAGFAVPGQNVIYGDVDGHIGRLTAAKLARRDSAPPPDLVLNPDAMSGWTSFAMPDDLPSAFDPPNGFVASANERPNNAAVPIGWFFSPEDRVKRLGQLLGGDRPVDADAVRRILVDTHLPSAAAFRDTLAAWLEDQPDARRNPESAELIGALAVWDGDYAAESHGAAAFELLVFHFAHALFGADQLAVLQVGWTGRARLFAAMNEAEPSRRAAALASALGPAARDFAGTPSWGALHRLVLRHPLGLAPLIGGLYRFADLPTGGSSDTLHKTAHGLVNGRHAANYGSTARYICDLSDQDRNYFVLLGGEDGFLGSANFLDQAPLWQHESMIEVPLRLETVRARFPFRTRVEPGGAPPS